MNEPQIDLIQGFLLMVQQTFITWSVVDCNYQNLTLFNWNLIEPHALLIYLLCPLRECFTHM